jgi:putative DNA primase/helicase
MSTTRQEELQRVQATLKWALKSESAPRINACLDLLRSEPGIPITPDELDCDPWLFNCRNGTLELPNGRLREHRPEDLITKLCRKTYDPNARAPVFEKFLCDIFPLPGRPEGSTSGNEVMIGYLQRFFGYCLTGDVSEQVLPVFWGVGANGKTTLINAITNAIGTDYIIKANRDLFMNKKGDNHPAQIARLFRVRLVVCSESGSGAYLDEALVKELTGGERLAARRMREDWWEFDPTHKAILVTNHKPQIRGTDHAIWRRVQLVPFTVIFAEDQQDKRLGENLQAEASGILRWAVEGCRQWAEHGLGAPPAVAEATREYRTEQDRLGRFLEERNVRSPEYRTRVTDLYADYIAWCRQNGEYQPTATAFGLTMGERGFHKDPGKRWYVGLQAIQVSGVGT